MQWLTTTPKVTTFRVNTLNRTTNEAKVLIENKISELKRLLPVSIQLHSDIPEVILIENGKLNAKSPAYNQLYKEIVVDASCGAAVLRGAHIYAPGVIGMLSETKLDEIVNVFVDVIRACKKGTNKTYQSEHKIFIGIGIVKMQRYQLFNTVDNIVPNGIAIEIIETVSTVPSLGNIFASLNNLGLLQNLPSIICGKVLNPLRNDIVLDMCAAPGNKTTHLAELMNDQGCIYALDRSAARAKLLQSNINEHGAKSIRCFAFDGTKSVNEATDRVRLLHEGPPFSEGTFDRILLDAPCSGLGNRPILVSNLSPEEQSSYPNLQKKLFATGVRLLKKNGILVYSTCTIFASENEGIVSWALDKFAQYIELVPAEPHFGGPGWPNVGLTDAHRYGKYHLVNTFFI